MHKRIGIALLIIGILTLAADILCAFWIGGVIVHILLVLSILTNTVGVMMLSYNKKR